ncbi:MAG: tetratricopeptide repeat protein [Sphingobacteriaceae bacterium]|nr:tetratricopeptide repeat protein [Sphingobacteriaceae bacterium]
MNRPLLFISFLLLTLNIWSNRIDSLFRVFYNEKNDSLRFEMIGRLIAHQSIKISDEEAHVLNDLAIHYADSTNNLKGKGFLYLLKGKHILNSESPNPYEGIEMGYKALACYEELKDIKGISTSYQLMGWFYHLSGNNEEALVYTLKALDLAEKNRIDKVKSNCYNNLGGIYSSLKDYSKSIKCYKMAAALALQENNWSKLARVYGNISEIYTNIGEYNESLKYRKKAIDLFRENHSRGGVIWHYAGLAEILVHQKNYNNAERFIDTVYTFATKDNWTELLKTCYMVQELLYKATGNIEKAYHFNKAYHSLNDSLNSAYNLNKISELKLFYEKQKNEKLKELEEIAAKEKHNAALQKQQIILTGVIIVLALISIFVLFIYRSLMLVKKKKAELEHKNKIIEEKQKEILDSMQYARRIQMAQIPNENRVELQLKRTRLK